MGITIRYRQLKEGKQKPYFDIVQDKQRRTETTRWWRYKTPKTPEEREHNKVVDHLVKELQNKLERELLNREFDFQKAKEGKADFIKLFKEEADERFKLRGYKSNTYCCYLHFIKFTGGTCFIGEIDKAFVIRFKEYLLSDKTRLNQNGACIYYKRFKRQLERAVKKGMLRVNPAEEVPNIPEIEPFRERLTEEEVRILMAAPCKYDLIKRMFLFSCFTGLRFSDLTGIKWLNVVDDKLIFHPVKTKVKEHVIHLNENAKKFMGERGKFSDQVFPWPYSGNKYDALREWVWSSGVQKKVTWHVGRHTFATLMLQKTGDIMAVKEGLLHARLETTMIYAKYDNRKLISAFKSLDTI